MTLPLRRPPRRAAAGFTLVEVLVALLLMALLAGLSWQALDGMLRARDHGRGAIDRAVRLSTVLTQWEQDLQALVRTDAVPPLTFDGQTLRVTRRVEGGVALVAWAVRGGVWQRWAGPATVRVGDLQQSWLRSQQFQGSEPGQVTVAEQASTWQIYYNRAGQWSNAQSTGDVVTPPAGAPGAPVLELLPDAVRLVVTLDGHALTRDIALGPGGG